MEGWFKVASVFVTATAAVAVAIAAYYESQRRHNEREHAYGNPSRERTNNDEFNAIYNQRQRSQNSTIEAKLREAKLKRAEKLAKLREERKRQLEEQEKKRKEEEDERKRKREEEEKERKKNEKMKSMLDSFDDVFDDEMGVKTDRVHVDENIDDWSRNAEKQKLKQEFRAKQMAQQQKSQNEKDQINSNNSTDDLKIEHQKSTVTKCVIDKKFKIQEFLLNAIISVNIENNFTLALSLRSIKKNKKKKVIDLQELESAVFSLQKILQENESPKTGAIPKNSKKKVKRKKAEEKIAAENKEEDKLDTVESCENCSSIFEQKELEDQNRKLEMQEKKREEIFADKKVRKQFRNDYNLAPTKSFEYQSNITSVQKQLENQNGKVNSEMKRWREANKMKSKPNFYDDEIVNEDGYYQTSNQLSELMFQTKSNFTQYQETENEKEEINRYVKIEQSKQESKILKSDEISYEDNYCNRSLNQLSELMFQTKMNSAQYQEPEDKKEIINGYEEKDKSKVAKQKSTILKHAYNKKFKSPNFSLHAIINVNTTNNDTVAVSLRGIEKNKKKKVIDLPELENAVCDMQEILQDSLQDHALPENATEKVKKPKTKEQIAARKRRKQLRKQKVMMQ